MFGLNSEILSIISALSAEKNISKNTVVAAIENAFAKVAMSHNYGDGCEVVVKMDLKSGEINFFKKKFVKSNPTEIYEISIQDASSIDGNLKDDDFVLLSMPPLPIQYLPVHSMKKYILEQICSAEKQLEYDEWKKREGEIITGVVKKSSNINLYVSLGGKTEAIIFREGLIKTDNFKAGDKIKAYIKEVKRSDRDCQVILSRTDNNFLAMLMAEAVTEIQDGMVEIKAISRSCGFKAKVAVISTDGRLDAVGACIGARGSRIKPIVDELRGEKVDIVYYDRDFVTFAKNAITPAKAVYGNYDEVLNSIELVIPDDQLKLAIGKSGINVRLASQLVGCNISIISESEKKKINQEKFNNAISLMCKTLDVDEAVAQFLVSSNIYTPEDLLAVGTEKLVKSGVFDENIANELIERAKKTVEKQQKQIEEEMKNLGISNDIMELNGMNSEIAILLAKNGIKTVKDIADLSNDEFVEICGEQFADIANSIIMNARQIAYGIN